MSQRKGQSRKKSTSRKKSASRKDLITFLLLLVVMTLTLTLAHMPPKRTPGGYKMTKVEASTVEIVGKPYVRPEGIRGSDDVEWKTNYGRVEEDGFTVQVSGLFEANIDKNNGTFYGFKVEELLEQPEGAWFSSEIEDDEDGIVWINYKYVHIIAP